MKLSFVRFSGSNPSMGPHNVPSSRTLPVAARPEPVADLLDNTTVNGAASLRAYLTARLDEDQDTARRIEAAFTPGRLSSGERIIDLVFGFADGRTVTLHDLRRFRISGDGYRRFDALIRSKGTVRQGAPLDLSPKR